MMKQEGQLTHQVAKRISCTRQSRKGEVVVSIVTDSSNGFTIFPATLGADEFTIHHKDIVNLLPNDVGLEVAPTMVLWTIM